MSKKANSDSVGNIIGTQDKMTVGKFLMDYNVVLILAALLIVGACISDVFFTYSNIMTVLRQQATYILIGIGSFLVMITGGIDLSVASTCAVSSVVSAHVLTALNWQSSYGGLALAIIVGIASGALIGAINGIIIAVFRVPAFIITLATMWAGEGIAYIISNGTTIMLDRKAFPANESFYQFAASTIPGIKVPWIVLVAVIFIVAFYVIMTFTTFGRILMATGSNETAAKYAGINTSKYYFSAYLICGILTGLAGIIVTAKAGSATPLTAGVDYGMTAIAGIVIGGTSMSGGEGTIPKTILGILIVAFISNIMNLINVAVYPQKVVKALIVIVAVIVKSFSEKK